MKNIHIILLLLVLLIHDEAKCDAIIINGKALSTYGFSPFDKYPGIVKLRERLKTYGSHCTEDGCSFFSIWKIIDNRLMLTKIESCSCNNKKQTANLKKLFGGRVEKGMMCAYWYTGEIWISKDEPNSWNPMFAASWPSQTQLVVKKGVVISVKDLVYPKPVESVYYKYPDSLHAFIFNHIDLNKFRNFPEHSDGSYFRFDLDEKGYLINLKEEDYFSRLHQTFNKDEMEEISRVLGLLQWPLYYNCGHPVNNFPGIQIVLSREMRNKVLYGDPIN